MEVPHHVIFDASTGATTYVPMSTDEIAAATPTLDTLKADKLDKLAHRRWEAEVGGMDFGAFRVRTDENSLAKMAAAYISAALDPDYSISTWEVAPGVFTALDNATILALGAAARAHVQSTFDHKAALHALIMAAQDADELDAIDLNAGWP